MNAPHLEKKIINESVPVVEETAAIDARALAKHLSRYREQCDRRATLEIAITLVPLIGLWLLMWLASTVSFWLALPLTLPAGFFLLRLFMIQHDCGHGSFFRSRKLNDWVGRIFGVITFTPYTLWRRSHALHHAGSGNLDRRGFGDVLTLTVDEYRSRTPAGRLRYRLYRHPLIMFGVGPAYLFLLQHRLPVGCMRSGWNLWTSTMGTNLAIALAACALVWLIGLKALLMIQLPIILIAATIGVWLFFVQHQFEETTWDHDDDWAWHEAALHGSSHYDLPGVLRWFTANIGLHHIHHLCSRIPYYRLPQVMRDNPSLSDVSRLTFWQSLGCVRLVLWDSNQRQMVSFREERALA